MLHLLLHGLLRELHRRRHRHTRCHWQWRLHRRMGSFKHRATGCTWGLWETRVGRLWHLGRSRQWSASLVTLSMGSLRMSCSTTTQNWGSWGGGGGLGKCFSRRSFWWCLHSWANSAAICRLTDVSATGSGMCWTAGARKTCVGRTSFQLGNCRNLQTQCSMSASSATSDGAPAVSVGTLQTRCHGDWSGFRHLGKKTRH